MKTLMFAVVCGVLSLMALPQTASAGNGFTVCIEGFCVNKGRKDRRHHHNRDRRSWDEYCYYNPGDYRCDRYRYRRPPPRDCYYSPEYGWECY